MNRINWVLGVGLMVALVLCPAMSAMAAVELGLANAYIHDEGIGEHPAVIAATGFESPQWAEQAFTYTRDLPEGYQHTTDPSVVLAGNGCLQIQQTVDTHQPYEFAPKIKATDVVYVRWYRRYEAGYDWTQHKMPGVYAKESNSQNGTAGVPPTGCDKYSCKLFVDYSARPAFYSYHPDQEGIYGDHFKQNIGTPVVLETERWYCFEMMLKSNTPDQHDGELKMWIDGELKGHVKGLRFRTCEKLKINEFTHSAYVGGHWVSKRNQKLWDDNLVIASEYIGPMGKNAPVTEEDPEPGKAPADSSGTPEDNSREPTQPNSNDGDGDGGCFVDSLMTLQIGLNGFWNFSIFKHIIAMFGLLRIPVALLMLFVDKYKFTPR